LTAHIDAKKRALKVKPTRNLMPPVYSIAEHIDLLEQLTFTGAYRKSALISIAALLGIKSP